MKKSRLFSSITSIFMALLLGVTPALAFASESEPEEYSIYDYAQEIYHYAYGQDSEYYGDSLVLADESFAEDFVAEESSIDKAAEQNSLPDRYAPELVIEFCETSAIEFNTNEILNSDDVVGIDALKPLNYIPGLELQSQLGARSAGHNSPETALSLSGYRIVNHVRQAPQGTWYSWRVWNNSVPSNLYTMVLSAPSNYMFILTNRDLSIMWQIPVNTFVRLSYAELASMFNINPNATHMFDIFLTVQVPGGSATPAIYNLYYGATHLNGRTGWIDTGQVHNFGVRPDATPSFWYFPAQMFNGMLNAHVPDGAMILDLWMSESSPWAPGFARFIDSPSGINYRIENGMQYRLRIPQGVHPVRQQFRFQARVRSSNNHSWRPRLDFNYTFPVVTDNNFRNFLPVRELR